MRRLIAFLRQRLGRSGLHAAARRHRRAADQLDAAIREVLNR